MDLNPNSHLSAKRGPNMPAAHQETELHSQTQDRDIRANIAVHDRVAESYDSIHGEIFNPVEQQRLAQALRVARDLVTAPAVPRRALDFGCGSGNLTRHLLALDFSVTAADVSAKFLDLVRRRFPSDELTTLRLNGRDLSELADDSVDLAATYSVLHHVPDYLAAVDELGRVVKPGGIVYIDHEPPDGFWDANPELEQFYREGRPYNWRKWFVPSNYMHKVWRLFDPHHANEGDIHVWPDDHIEWHRIDAVLAKRGFELAKADDYLLFRSGYRSEVYERFRTRCWDMRCVAYRKRVEPIAPT
jgi:ubiquinone/menaquinone biosynthesis C-methylase UbiE